MNAALKGIEASPLTTRVAVVDRVAADWLAAHPQTPVTKANLSKTVQQMLTEVFRTGEQRRGGGGPSRYAESLMQAAGLDANDVASARVFSKSGDLPICYAAVFANLSTLLAPLAAAVQLARTAIADAAVALLTQSGNPLGITRLTLRGFVEARVRPHAIAIHERVGHDLSAREYLDMLLADIEQLAAAVVRAAARKAGQETRMSDQSRAGFERFFGVHGKGLRAETHKYGADADEVYSTAIEKLAIAYRNNPALEADLAYARTVCKNAWLSYRDEQSRRAEVVCEEIESETPHQPLGEDSGDQIAGIDAIVRRLLGTAETLSAPGTPEGTLAGRLLSTYFFVDPTIRDPRRAQLSSHVWQLADNDSGGALENGLRELARKDTSTAAHATRIAAMVITALRHRKDQHDGPGNNEDE